MVATKEAAAKVRNQQPYPYYFKCAIIHQEKLLVLRCLSESRIGMCRGCMDLDMTKRLARCEKRPEVTLTARLTAKWEGQGTLTFPIPQTQRPNLQPSTTQPNEFATKLARLRCRINTSIFAWTSTTFAMQGEHPHHGEKSGARWTG